MDAQVNMSYQKKINLQIFKSFLVRNGHEDGLIQEIHTM